MPSNIIIGRRKLLQGVGAAGALAMAGVSLDRALSADTRTVNIQLGWLIDYNQTGEIVAQKKNYFKDEGLTLVIQPGGSNIDGVALVASGQAQIGQIPSSPSLMLASSHQIPVIAFAVGAQHHPFAFFSLPKNPVRTTQDMVGKKIGIQSTSKILIDALLKKDKIDASKVEIVPIGYDMVPLLSGQVDAISGWVIDTSVLKALGPDFVTMSLWDSGIKLYSDVYYTTHDAVEKDSDMLVRFLRATARGWQYAYEHPDEATAALVEANSNMDPAETRSALGALLKFEFNETTKQNGWGAMDPAVWAQQIKIYDDLGQFSAGPPKLEDIMTTSILDATKDVRAKLG